VASKLALASIAGKRASPPCDAGGAARPSLKRVAGGTFALRLAHLGLTFLTGLLLARLLGADGYGAFAYAIAWVTLLVMPAQLGFNKLLVREVAACLAREDWAHLRGILRFADGLVLAAATAAALIAVGISYWLPASDPQMLACFRLGMALVPLMAWLQIKRATLEGLERVRTGQVPETLIQPLLLLGLIALGWAMLGERFSATLALVAALVAVALAALVSAVATHRLLPAQVRSSPPRFAPRGWLVAALPMMAVGTMAILTNRTDVVMLGLMRGAADAGVYEISGRLARLVPFALFAINSTVAPRLAQLSSEHRYDAMQTTLTRCARGAFTFALPVALAFLLLGDLMLGIFGPAFPRGHLALAILAAGQLVNVAAGSSGHTLLMAGREKDALPALVLAVIANVALNVALIPPYGMAGAAIATASSLILWNLLLIRRLAHGFRLNPTILSWPR